MVDVILGQESNEEGQEREAARSCIPWLEPDKAYHGKGAHEARYLCQTPDEAGKETFPVCRYWKPKTDGITSNTVCVQD